MEVDASSSIFSSFQLILREVFPAETLSLCSCLPHLVPAGKGWGGVPLATALLERFSIVLKLLPHMVCLQVWGPASLPQSLLSSLL